jgi:hypothetical protein
MTEYQPTTECFIIKEQYNKHHCHVPAAVWGIPAVTVCQVCRAKNYALFMEASLQSVLAPIQEPIPVSSNVIQFHKPVPSVKEKVTKRQLCTVCRRGAIYVKLWNQGMRLCCECRRVKKEKRLRNLVTA